jgi:GNAT superfamily N-acetyltransferase
LRAFYRKGARCQIVRDSVLPRRLADPWIVLREGSAVAYGGVWNRHFEGRLMEFYAVPRSSVDPVRSLRELVAASGATHMEAQTNMASMLRLLRACATDIAEENLLFEDGARTDLSCPGATFRRRREDDDAPDGEWVVSLGGDTVAGGGVLTHYNRPYGDLYLEVRKDFRGRGVGSWMVQELRRVARDAGHVPVARCAPENEASRRTLERGGLVACGSLLVGRVDPAG